MGQTSEVLVSKTLNFPLIGDQPSLFEAKITDGASRLEDFRKSQGNRFLSVSELFRQAKK